MDKRAFRYSGSQFIGVAACVALGGKPLGNLLLAVGAAAVTISGGWSVDFIYETLQYPVNVAFIVLVVSVIFNNYSRYIFRVLLRSSAS